MRTASPGAAMVFSGLKNDYLFVMRRWAEFSGRSGRSEFWSYQIAYIGLYLLAFLCDSVASAFIGHFRGFRACVAAFHALPGLALLSRRLHDIDRRAWFMVWPFVAVRALFEPGTVGANRFGPEPVPRGEEGRLDGPHHVDAQGRPID